MRRSAILALFLALATALGACGGHHGQFLHQNRPGGNDTPGSGS